MDTDDKTILRRLKRGDAAALEAAVRQYSGYVTAVIGNQLGPCAAAEDIEELASDVFVALWRAPQPLRTEHLRGWLGKVARNQAISFFGGSIYNSSGTRTASSSMTATRRSYWRRRSAARF